MTKIINLKYSPCPDCGHFMWLHKTNDNGEHYRCTADNCECELKNWWVKFKRKYFTNYP